MKNDDLPGIEGKGVASVSIAEVDDAIEQYVAARDRRMTMTTFEVAAKQALIGALHTHAEEIGTSPDGTIYYRHDALLCTLRAGKDELKVKNIKTEQEEL
jgi:hypothetical protein